MRWNWFHTLAEPKVAVKSDVCKIILTNLFSCFLPKGMRMGSITTSVVMVC